MNWEWKSSPQRMPKLEEQLKVRVPESKEQPRKAARRCARFHCCRFQKLQQLQLKAVVSVSLAFNNLPTYSYIVSSRHQPQLSSSPLQPTSQFTLSQLYTCYTVLSLLISTCQQFVHIFEQLNHVKEVLTGFISEPFYATVQDAADHDSMQQ